MKRIKQLGLYAAAGCLALLALTGCKGQPTDISSTPASSSAAPTDGRIGEERAETRLLQAFGRYDEETGDEYSFSLDGMITLDGREYYNFRVSLMKEAGPAYLTNYIVSTDGAIVKEYKPDA